MARRFKWEAWDFDLCGNAYIIAKDECLNKEDVPDFICKEDHLSSDCKSEMVVEEGWCKWQVRTDWYDYDGEARGWYVVEPGEKRPGKSGWFPVWIVRKCAWY